MLCRFLTAAVVALLGALLFFPKAALAVPLSSGGVPNSQGCSNNSTCGPSFCVRVPNASCCSSTGTFTPAGGTCAAASSPPLGVSSVACKQCAASADARCTSAGLQSLLMLQSGIKAAYCNEDFLVVHSDGTPGHPTYLDQIQRPPGSVKSGATYDTQCVTRNMNPQWLAMKIPLRPVALNTASAAANNVNAFPAGSMLTGIPLPKSGPASMTVNGLPLFPAYNDQSTLSWTSCEMDGCNAHVGQGFDYHYHGDPFGGADASCLYSAANYSSPAAHPPLIGWGMDGFALHGRYLDSDAPGQAAALDDCGGHEHAGVAGYHYHAQVLQQSSPGGPYTAYIAGPYKCWKGNVSAIPAFFDLTGKPTVTVGYGAGRELPTRTDYAQLQPCCGSAEYYAASGYSINGAAQQTPTGQPPPTASPVPAQPPPSTPPATPSPEQSPPASALRPPPSTKSPPPPRKKSSPPLRKKSPPPPRKKRPPPRSGKKRPPPSKRQN